jgi:hypothetical protein
MRATTILVGAIAILTSRPAWSQSQSRRVALIIANSRYVRPEDRLAGPPNDAAILQRALKDIGFVGPDGSAGSMVVGDVTREQLQNQVIRFSEALAKAGPQALGFLYYAGHGFGEVNGDNYMLPVDVDAHAADAKDRSVGMAKLQQWLQARRSGDVPYIIVVLNACRSKDAAGDFRMTLLHEPPPGMLFAMSTGAGQTASDSDVYATALADKLNSPGITFAQLFDEVMQDVATRSGNTQVPLAVSKIHAPVCPKSCGDPRKDLAGEGVTWTIDSFFEAVRRGDLPVVKKFLEGHMATGTNDTHGSSLAVMLAQNKTNAASMLDLLLRGGVDIEAEYSMWAADAPQTRTLLGRAIEAENLLLLKALLAHKARTDKLMQTYGAMGTTVNIYPLAAAIYLEHFEVAKVLLDGGTDPSTGDYAAYREARAHVEKRRLQPPLPPLLQDILARTAPPDKVRRRVEAGLRLRAVERELNEVGLAAIWTMRGSDHTRLQKRYDALQVERAQLQDELGIARKPSTPVPTSPVAPTSPPVAAPAPAKHAARPGTRPNLDPRNLGAVYPGETWRVATVNEYSWLQDEWCFPTLPDFKSRFRIAHDGLETQHKGTTPNHFVTEWIPAQVFVSNRGKLRIVYDRDSEWPSSFVTFSPRKTAEWQQSERYENDDGSVRSGNPRLVLSCRRCKVDEDQGTYTCSH